MHAPESESEPAPEEKPGSFTGCTRVTTARGHRPGRSVVARVVTYGTTSPFEGQTDWSGNIDVSPSVLAALTDQYPPYMEWQFTRCPDSTGTLAFEFKSASSAWWAAVWIRSPRVPVRKVEVQANGSSQWIALTREGDGSLWGRDFGTSFTCA